MLAFDPGGVLLVKNPERHRESHDESGPATDHGHKKEQLGSSGGEVTASREKDAAQ